jgi:hypothetical protein
MNVIRFSVLLLVLGLAFPTLAVSAEVTCKDGTMDKGGRGACRGHGGVDKKATAAAKKEHKAQKAKAHKEHAALPAAADESAATVTCKDGASSKAGRGACRGHGGVDKKAGAAMAPTPVMPSASEPDSAAPSDEEEDDTPAVKTTDPSGAIARCKDGTYSHAKGHRGACSRHDGVADWLDK